MTIYSLSSNGHIFNIYELPTGGISAETFYVNSVGKLEKSAIICGLTKVKVNILVASVVKEQLTGRCIPVILVLKYTTATSSNIDGYILGIDLENKKFTALRKLVIEAQVLKCAPIIHLVDGPAVLISRKSKIYLFRSKYEATLKIYKYPLTSILGSNMSANPEILGVYFEENLEEYFIFLRMTVEGQHPQAKISLMSIASDSVNLSLLDINVLVPEEYTAVVTSLYMKHIQCTSAVTPASEPYDFKSEIIIGTLEGYVIYISNGCTNNCVKVGENPIQYLNMMTTTRVSNKKYLLIGSEKSYCILDEQLCVTSSNLNCKHVFIGDFLQTGCEQFLFLDDDVVEGTTCRLNDGESQIFINKSDESPSEGSISCSQVALKALKGRLQKDQRLLDDENQAVKTTEKFLTEMFLRQVSLADGSCQSQSYQSDLLPLVIGDTDVDVTMNTSPTEITVQDTWQRTYAGKWCIGVDIVCKMTSTVSLWLDTVQEGSAICTKSSYITVHPRSIAVAPDEDSHTFPTSKLQQEKASSDGLDSDISFPMPKKVRPSISSADAVTLPKDSSGMSVSDDSDSDINFPRPKKVRPSISSSDAMKLLKEGGKKLRKLLSQDKCVQSETRMSNFSNERSSEVLPAKASTSEISTEEMVNAGKNKSGAAGGVGEQITVTESKVSVICTQNVPTFEKSGSIIAKLVLNWKNDMSESGNINQHRKSCNESSTTQIDPGVSDRQNTHMNNCHCREEGRIYTRCCGETTLTVNDVLENRHELSFNPVDEENMADFEENRRDQVAWHSIQTCTHLEVASALGIVHSLESVLTQRCGFEYCHCWDCYVTSRTRLSRVQIRLGEQTHSSRRDMDVFTSSEDDLYLLVHYLYSKLPDHLAIDAKETTVQEVKDTCIPVLQKEAHFLSQGLRKLLNDYEARQASGDSEIQEESDENDLRKVGEKFKRKRENLVKNQTGMLDLSSKEGKHFLEKLEKVQERTDQVIVGAFSKFGQQ